MIDEEYERDCEIRIRKLKQDFNEWGSEVRKKEQAYNEEQYSAAHRRMLSIPFVDEDDYIPFGDIIARYSIVENLVLIPCELEGISDDTSDVPNCDNNRINVEQLARHRITDVSISKDINILITTHKFEEWRPVNSHIFPQYHWGIDEADIDPNEDDFIKVDDIKMNDDKVSRQIPIDTIVMPIRITFDNPIDFNDHFSKPKDLTVALDSTESSILPPPLLDSDSPFTAELSASITLNSLGNEDKVFKPGILVYHAIHDKNLVTLEKNLRENISSGTLLFLKEPSSPRPPPEPPDVCMRFKPILAMKNDFVKPNEDFYLSETVLSLNVEDVDSFTFIIWTFLPYFTYPEDSPLIFSFRSENFVFDPGIVTFHKPVACSMKVFHLLSLRTN
ncbi:hypothetical protein Tco_0891161 [Tanacetum coccineum]|uniref:Uncharacterized protein n=1 Tax=Tanacetum coccineum TaxID=301880 RepID=A0ABQ5C7L6_9ASTR